MRCTTALLLLAALAGTARPAAPEELKKLHVLMVFDTLDKALGAGLQEDHKRLTRLLQGTIPAERCSLEALTGKEATGENLFARIRALRARAGPRDAILFFYGGHGAINEKHGHVLKFSSGGDVQRKAVRRELERCRAGLTVILTDCCSTKEKFLGEAPALVFPRSPTSLSPTVSHLLFRNRGLVDITAATQEEAWSDDENGGLFTRSLCRLLLRDIREMDRNRDGFLTWAEFFPQLQKETQLFFRDWSAKMKARYPDHGIRAETQKPHAFFLGKQALYAVVEIENARASALHYRFRWEGETVWRPMKIEPGKRMAHVTMLDEKDEALPRLEIHREGAARPDRLASVKWDSPDTPRNLPLRFRIRK